MTEVGPMPNGKTYSDTADGPNSMTGPTGFGYATYLIELLGQILVVAGQALTNAGSALASANAASDALTAANAAASNAQDSEDAAAASAAGAAGFDQANYARKDSGQSTNISAAWTFLTNIAMTGVDLVRGGVIQTRVVGRYTVATGSSNVDLPASPADGDRVILAFSGDYTASAATVGRNGSNINGVAEDLTIDTINGVEKVELEYDGDASSWGVV